MTHSPKERRRRATKPHTTWWRAPSARQHMVWDPHAPPKVALSPINTSLTETPKYSIGNPWKVFVYWFSCLAFIYVLANYRPLLWITSFITCFTLLVDQDYVGSMSPQKLFCFYRLPTPFYLRSKHLCQLCASFLICLLIALIILLCVDNYPWDKHVESWKQLLKLKSSYVLLQCLT